MALCALITIMVLSLNGHVLCVQSEENLNYTFPKRFMFGAATSAYQIEGAWNVSGKGLSVWDTLTHNHPSYILDNSNGDDAAKSYDLYEEDAKLLKDMGMNHYRFSIAWTRIMPKGLPNKINQEGIDHYNKVIDNLLENGIEPMVTLFHWDIPQYLEDMGGWTNPFIVKAFEEYARVAFENFGDRVKWWITINEPEIHSLVYEGHFVLTYNPNMLAAGVGTYMATKNMLLAHASAYRLYEKIYKEPQKGKVSLSMAVPWYEPLDPNSAEDKYAADLANNAALGWFAGPIYGNGDFPDRMKMKIEELSKKEGFPWSRLPELSSEEQQLIKGTYDFCALNHYGAHLVTAAEPSSDGPSLTSDLGVDIINPWWLPASNTNARLSMSPQSLRRVMRKFKQQYGDVQIFITENGFADEGELEDEMRKTFIGTYLTEMWKAMYIDGVNAIGYTVWSAIDNMEWKEGYSARFGLYYVNFTDPARPRIPKASSRMMKEITSSHKIPQKYVDLASNFSLDIRPEKS